MEASVIAEAEFIQIGLIVAAASMIGAKKEYFEVANGNVNPFEISDFIL